MWWIHNAILKMFDNLHDDASSDASEASRTEANDLSGIADAFEEMERSNKDEQVQDPIIPPPHAQRKNHTNERANAERQEQDPPALEETRPRKRLRQKTVLCEMPVTSNTVQVTPAKRKGDNQSTVDMQQFFTIECLTSAESPDPRVRLEHEIQILENNLRDEPTIPADKQNPSKLCSAALLIDAAVELPSQHCAFKGYTGTTRMNGNSSIICQRNIARC